MPHAHRAAVLTLAVGLLALGACGHRAIDDPWADLRNPALPENRRAEALERVWVAISETSGDRAAAREDLKWLAWPSAEPPGLRLAALRILLSDPDPAGEADSRAMLRLMLPRERDPLAIELLSTTAAERGWTEATPALVRSLSRADPRVRDEDRPEYRAIARLHPGTPVPAAVFEVFTSAPETLAADAPYAQRFGADAPERVRADAWDVLARLDADGALRRSLLDPARDRPDAAPNQTILGLRAASAELRCLPRTGPELRWLATLRDPGEPKNRLWWAQAGAAIGTLDAAQLEGLALHHAEPIRWAAANRPAWLRMSQADLLAELGSRLDGRPHHRRTASDPDLAERMTGERLTDWRERMRWADALAALVVDEALRTPGMADVLVAQAQLDRQDQTAEFGGVLEAKPRDAAVTSAPGSAAAAGDGTPPPAGAAETDAERFVVILYPPRPSDRQGDRTFVAPEDMMAQSARSLAHYHFHAQRARSAEYAGPAAADLDYAARLGRNCLVFTSLREDRLGVDLYLPNGVILDLGELRAGAAR